MSSAAKAGIITSALVAPSLLGICFLIYRYYSRIQSLCHVISLTICPRRSGSKDFSLKSSDDTVSQSSSCSGIQPTVQNKPETPRQVNSDDIPMCKWPTYNFNGLAYAWAHLGLIPHNHLKWEMQTGVTGCFAGTVQEPRWVIEDSTTAARCFWGGTQIFLGRSSHVSTMLPRFVWNEHLMFVCLFVCLFTRLAVVFWSIWSIYRRKRVFLIFDFFLFLGFFVVVVLVSADGCCIVASQLVTFVRAYVRARARARVCVCVYVKFIYCLDLICCFINDVCMCCGRFECFDV